MSDLPQTTWATVVRKNRRHKKRGLDPAERQSVASGEQSQQKTKPAPPKYGTLTNSIHPIFRRSNFILEPEVDTHALDGAGQGYEMMHAALQLASKFLSREAPLGFWYTQFRGSVEPANRVLYPFKDAQEDGAGKHWTYTDHQTVLTESQLLEVEADLISLADRVKFGVADRNNWRYCPPCGTTESFGIVGIPRADLRYLRNVYEQWLTTGGEGPQARAFALASFIFASTLCHELAHAAEWDKSSQSPVGPEGKPNDYYYHPGCSVAEDGFVWETAMFGGVVIARQRLHDNPQGDVFLRPWPNCTIIVGCYVEDGLALGVRLQHSETLIPPREDGQFAEKLPRISSTWFEQMFTQERWESCAAPRGGPAFPPDLDIHKSMETHQDGKTAQDGEKKAEEAEDGESVFHRAVDPAILDRLVDLVARGFTCSGQWSDITKSTNAEEREVVTRALKGWYNFGRLRESDKRASQI